MKCRCNATTQRRDVKSRKLFLCLEGDGRTVNDSRGGEPCMFAVCKAAAPVRVGSFASILALNVVNCPRANQWSTVVGFSSCDSVCSI